jgi:hypothetical protein
MLQRVHRRKNPSLSGLVRFEGVQFVDCQLYFSPIVNMRAAQIRS